MKTLYFAAVWLLLALGSVTSAKVANINSNSPICGQSVANAVTNYEIIGGRPAVEGEFPFLASFQMVSWMTHRFEHVCGGSIINENYILTAAHCILDVGTVDEVRVVTGIFNLNVSSSRQSVHPVAEIIPHEKFSAISMEHDMALIRLTVPIDLNDYVNSVCLPTDEQEFEGHLTLSGWGSQSEGGTVIPILMAVDIPLIDKKACESVYGAEHVFEGNICAGDLKGGHDSCRGDSGGPLIQRDVEGRAVLAGLVSWSIGCARAGYPGINTRVAHYIQWINSKM